MLLHEHSQYSKLFIQIVWETSVRETSVTRSLWCYQQCWRWRWGCGNHGDVVCAAPSAPLNVLAEAYSPSVIRVTWRPPAQPRGPLTDIVYVVDWHSFNADGSRAEGRVETGSRPHKVISRSLQGHSDDLQRVLVSDLQPSRTYSIRVCITSHHITSHQITDVFTCCRLTLIVTEQVYNTFNFLPDFSISLLMPVALRLHRRIVLL